MPFSCRGILDWICDRRPSAALCSPLPALLLRTNHSLDPMYAVDHMAETIESSEALQHFSLSDTTI